MKGLTDIPGILVGHASDFDALTGCTAILCPEGAVAGLDLRGSATGTIELETLAPTHVTDRIHGITLAGGSAFGLEASCGVRAFLEERGIGYDTGAAKVPIVPGAILYDLAIGSSAVRPNRQMGYSAAAAAENGPVQEGAVGAGTGATVGKFLGMRNAMKSGVGTHTVALAGEWEGVLVSALAVVNAFGDVREPDTGRLLAGTRRSWNTLELADSRDLMMRARGAGRIGTNTTLVVLATNALLSKVESTNLARMASAGVARSISPVWTTFDGDLVIALSAGEKRVAMGSLGVAAAEAVAQAIVRAAQMAPTLGGLPGLAG